VTYSDHAMALALIEKAVKDGREAYLNHLPQSENPYTGRYAQWWAVGWHRGREGK